MLIMWKLQRLSLTMNRVCLLVLFLFVMSLGSISAQNYGGWGNNYTNVLSYDGVTNINSFTIKLSTNSPLDIKEGWTLSVKAISKSSGKEFPLQKLYLQPFAIEGAANDPGPLPTLSQLGIAPANYLKKNTDVLLIPASSVPLYHKATNSSYFNFQLSFSLSISSGNYLNSLRGAEYPIEFVFTFRDSEGSFIGAINLNHTIRVNETLSGTPPPENNFSLEISGPAKNGQLDVKSMSDYINGASVKYDKGIVVSSNAPYQLTVKSLQNEFKSELGNTLPLDVVNVKLMLNNSSHATTVNEVKISTAPQILLKGSSTNSLPQSFDLIYNTNGNDERLFKTKSENYSTTLTYEMTVQ